MDEEFVQRIEAEGKAKYEAALAAMTPEIAIVSLREAAKILGDHDYLTGEHHLNIIADWLKAQQEKIDFQRAGVRGTIIGALAGGHMDAPDGGQWSKATLANIADMMNLEVPEEIKKANGLHW